jgi:hypothetical protein
MMTTTTTTNDDELYIYEPLNIRAPKPYWQAFHAECFADKTVRLAHSFDAEELLVLGIHETGGGTGDEVVAWAIHEAQRRMEKRTASTAQAREAVAIQSLAAAISHANDQDILRKILVRVSEKTRYAINQQLKGNPL